jgi:hypothetical protein
LYQTHWGLVETLRGFVHWLRVYLLGLPACLLIGNVSEGWMQLYVLQIWWIWGVPALLSQVV